MTRPRVLVSQALVAVIVAVWLASVAAQGQRPAIVAKTWSVPRTPWGHPDLQGIWTNFDPTPFEQSDRVLRDDEVLSDNPWAIFDSPLSPRRASLVVDPPNGRVPVLPEAIKKRDSDRTRLEESWEYHRPSERCITRGVPAGMFPPIYNNGYQILQSSSYVAIVAEMIHNARIIPVDGRSHIDPSVRLWDGDSVGHWEGDTLVVDTTNYNGRGTILASTKHRPMLGIPQSDVSHVVERFTLVDANTINYEVTVDDPKVFARPWKVALPFNRDQNYQIYEYACHEGNRRYMEGSLSGYAPIDEDVPKTNRTDSETLGTQKTKQR